VIEFKLKEIKKVFHLAKFEEVRCKDFRDKLYTAYERGKCNEWNEKRKDKEVRKYRPFKNNRFLNEPEI
jgi:hypothetical protein